MPPPPSSPSFHHSVHAAGSSTTPSILISATSMILRFPRDSRHTAECPLLVCYLFCSPSHPSSPSRPSLTGRWGLGSNPQRTLVNITLICHKIDFLVFPKAYRMALHTEATRRYAIPSGPMRRNRCDADKCADTTRYDAMRHDAIRRNVTRMVRCDATRRDTTRCETA